MRDFANSRDGKLIIPDLRRFGIMMPWWKWSSSWKIPIARGMGRWHNHFLNGLTYFSCPWFCDSADHTVVCLFCHFVNWFSQKFNGRLVRPVCLFKFWLFADFGPASKSCHFLPGAENFLWFIAKKQLIFFFKMAPRRSLYDELFSRYDFLKLFIFPFFLHMIETIFFSYSKTPP